MFPNETLLINEMIDAGITKNKRLEPHIDYSIRKIKTNDEETDVHLIEKNAFEEIGSENSAPKKLYFASEAHF